MKTIGLYIHLPFCKKKCPYCDFYSSTDIDLMAAYFQALEQELDCYDDLLNSSIIKTIYVGGGTPSLVAPNYLRKFFSKIDKKDAVELTIEVNPDSFEESFAQNCCELGFNRLSIGVQSFVDEELKLLKRIHTAKQSYQAVALAEKYFDNLSLDLIYGLPNQTTQQALYSVNQAVNLPIKHLSAYELTIYPGTKFQIQGYLADQEPDKYLAISQKLKSCGYGQYEISNYAKNNYQSRHNLGYWQDVEYLGLGISATSYLNDLRITNISSMQQYLNKNFEYQKEVAVESEYIISALRTLAGLDFKKYQKKFQKNFLEKYQAVLAKLQDMFTINESSVCLNQKGQIFSNKVFEEFI